MSDPAAHAPIIVVMGVTGSGKTTIGTRLAKVLKLPFYDADNFHSPASQAKLASDVPLDDADREPWLEAISMNMRKWADSTGAVLACSALKHRYRSMFRAAAPGVKFIYLDGDPHLIASRVQQRSETEEHVVKDFVRILKGQYRDLEIPTSAMRVDIHQTPHEIVEQIVSMLAPHLPPTH